MARYSRRQRRPDRRSSRKTKRAPYSRRNTGAPSAVVPAKGPPIIVPVNVTQVQMAATSYEIEAKLDRYLKIAQSIQREIDDLSTPSPEFISTGARSRREILDTFDEEVFLDYLVNNFYATDYGRIGFRSEMTLGLRSPAQRGRLLNLVNRLYFDPRFVWKGLSKDFLPVGLAREYYAVFGPDATTFDYGILSSSGLQEIGVKVSESTVRAKVIELAESVYYLNNPQPDKLPFAFVGNTTQPPVSALTADVVPPREGGAADFPVYYLLLGELGSTFSVAGLSVLGRKTPVSLSLLSILSRSSSLLDGAEWKDDAIVYFCRPGPVYHEVGKDETEDITKSERFERDILSASLVWSDATGKTRYSRGRLGGEASYFLFDGTKYTVNPIVVPSAEETEGKDKKDKGEKEDKGPKLVDGWYPEQEVYLGSVTGNRVPAYVAISATGAEVRWRVRKGPAFTLSLENTNRALGLNFCTPSYALQEALKLAKSSLNFAEGNAVAWANTFGVEGSSLEKLKKQFSIIKVTEDFASAEPVVSRWEELSKASGRKMKGLDFGQTLRGTAAIPAVRFIRGGLSVQNRLSLMAQEEFLAAVAPKTYKDDKGRRREDESSARSFKLPAGPLTQDFGLTVPLSEARSQAAQEGRPTDTDEFRDRNFRFILDEKTPDRIYLVYLSSIDPDTQEHKYRVSVSGLFPSSGARSTSFFRSNEEIYHYVIRREAERARLAKAALERARSAISETLTAYVSRVRHFPETAFCGFYYYSKGDGVVDKSKNLASTGGRKQTAVYEGKLIDQFFTSSPFTLPGEDYFGEDARFRQLASMRKKGVVSYTGRNEENSPTLLMLSFFAENAPEIQKISTTVDEQGKKSILKRIGDNRTNIFGLDDQATLESLQETEAVQGEEAVVRQLSRVAQEAIIAPRKKEYSPSQSRGVLFPRLDSLLGGSRSPLEKAVFTLYGSLDDFHVQLMEDRNRALRGTDANPKDAAYSHYLRYRPESFQYGIVFQKAYTRDEMRNLLLDLRREAGAAQITVPAQFLRKLNLPESVLFPLDDEEYPLRLVTRTQDELDGPRGQKYQTRFRPIGSQDGLDVFLRSRGPMSFDELCEELGEGSWDSGFARFLDLRGLDGYLPMDYYGEPILDARGEPLQRWQEPDQLIAARIQLESAKNTPDKPRFASLLSDTEKRWIRSSDFKINVFDVGLDEFDFEEIEGEEKYFNLRAAWTRIIFEEAGIVGSITEPIYDLDEDGQPDGQIQSFLSMRTEQENLVKAYADEGMGALEMKERGIVMALPYSLVGALQCTDVVLSRSLAGKGVRRKIKAMPASRESGQLKSGTSIVLTNLKIPGQRKTNLPSEEALAAVFKSRPGAPTFYPSEISDVAVLERFVKASYFSDYRSIFPLSGTLHDLPPFFSLDEMREMFSFDAVIAAAEEKEDKKLSREEKEEIIKGLYIQNLANKLSSPSSRKRDDFFLEEARRAYAAGTARKKSRAKRTGSVDPTTQIYKPRTVYADPSAGVVAVQEAFRYVPKEDILDLASLICKEFPSAAKAVASKTSQVVGLDFDEGATLSADALGKALIDQGEATLKEYQDLLDLLYLKGEVEITIGAAVMDALGIRPVWNKEEQDYFYPQGSMLYKDRVYKVETALSGDPDGEDVVVYFAEQPEDLTDSTTRLIQDMGRLGINIPVKPKVPDLAYYKALRSALQQYMKKANVSYKVKPTSGQVLSNLQARIDELDEALSGNRLRPGERRAAAEEARVLRKILDFSENYYDRLARRNPATMEEKDVATVLQYLEDKKPEDLEAAKAAFERLRQKSDPKNWNISRASVGSYFPREGNEKPNTWDLVRRVKAALGTHDLLARLQAITPNTVVGKDASGIPITARALTEQILRKEAEVEEAAIEAAAFQDKQGLALVIQQAQLSVDQMRQVLDQQAQKVFRRGREGGRITLPASSAVCKIRRRRKTSLDLPGSVKAALKGDELKNSVVIMMSPRGQASACPRVMTWRRGYHIDCDMVSNDPRAMTDLLGKAIQSALYWVTEKPSKRKTGASAVKVYVGRFGDGYLYTIWEPGQPVSLETVTEALQKMPRPLTGVDREKEVSAYIASLDDIDFDMSRCGEDVFGAPPPSEPLPPRTPPPRTPPSTPEGVTGTSPENLFSESKKTKKTEASEETKASESPQKPKRGRRRVVRTERGTGQPTGETPPGRETETSPEEEEDQGPLGSG